MTNCLIDMHLADPVRALASPLSIGNVDAANRVFLAPMSGVSDAPFRTLAAEFGAGLVVSEMVASDHLVRGEAEAQLRSERAGSGPHVVQLAGREAHWMAEGARAAADAGADVIDINMGCPAKKVTNGYAGSALMRDLDHALTLIEATVGATSLPVTLKMRLGWDDRSVNAPELARRAEAAGVRMITVHGRTRCQFYNGSADWMAIRAVKEAVSVPLIANGDLVDASQLGAMLAASGADGVMIGRGAYGRPWMPGHLAAFSRTGQMPVEPSGRALADLVHRHYDAILRHYGPIVGVRAARKHLGWYADVAGSAATRGSAIRTAMLIETRPAEVVRLIEACFAEAPERRAA